MIERNRKENNKALDYALEHYDMDLIAINDQEFQDYDFRDDKRIKYVGGYKERQGIVRARNQILEWFYNSEYDWAVWLDGNVKVSKTTLNDFRTVVDACKRDLLEIDVVTATFGNVISGKRIEARKAPDHLENIKLVQIDGASESPWIQCLFMRNFKKVYGMTPYLDSSLDITKGIMDDVYFVTLLRKLFEVRQCPTIVFGVPGNNKSSTWMPDQTKYPAPQYAHIRRLVEKAPYTPVKNSNTKKTYVIPRVEYMKEKLTVYKPRGKKKGKGGLI